MVEDRFTLAGEDCAILQTDGWAGSEAAFEAALSGQLGGALPSTTGETVAVGECRVIRLAPRRFWLVGKRPQDLSVEPELGSVVKLDEGRVRLRLAGSRLFEVLSRCVAIDWLSPQAKPGRAVQTGFHRVPVLIVRTADQECDLIAPRSFAKSLSEWMLDVAASLGQPTKPSATEAVR